MSGAAASGGFRLRHPLAEPFLAFNLLPSRTLHATQAALLAPALASLSSSPLSSLHRHWSAELIAACQLEPVIELDDPALPLAMLPPDSLDRLVVLAGALLAGQRIRRCIVRDEVQSLRTELGDAVLEFARRRAPTLHPGLAEGVDWSPATAAESAATLGNALLARAFEQASVAVARRGLLRLPTDAPELGHRLPIDAREALRLSLSLLPEVDPSWFSLFPVTH